MDEKTLNDAARLLQGAGADPAHPYKDKPPTPQNELGLVDRMRNLADTGHPRADELRDLAAKLDEVLQSSEGYPKRLLGAWARARRVWCECTGEPLI